MAVTWADSASKHGVPREDAMWALTHFIYEERGFEVARPPATVAPDLYIGPAAGKDGPVAGGHAGKAPTLEPVDISRHAAASRVPSANERRENHPEGKAMSTKTRRTAEQKAEEARGQALATWAETEMDIDPQGPRSRFAAPEDEAGRTMLEEALGGPAALARALGGRPTLDPAGAPSRERKVRLSPPLDQRIKAAIDGGVGKDFSALARAALVEYLDRHEHQASA